MAWVQVLHDQFNSFSGWTTESGTASVSGGLLIATSDARIRNNYTVTTANTATEIQLSDPDNYTFRIFARCQDTLNNNAYAVYAARNSATNAYIYLQKWVGGSFSNLSGGLYDFTNGDILRIEVEGTTLRAIRNTTTLFSVTDSSHSAAGKAGVYLETSTTLDNFKIFQYTDAPQVSTTQSVAVSESVALNIYEPVKPEATPDTITISESVTIEIEPESLNPSVSDTITVSEYKLIHNLLGYVYDGFESYTNGDLDGQGGWTISPTYTTGYDINVQSSVVHDGSKGIESVLAGSPNTYISAVFHTIYPSTEGIQSFWVRGTTTTARVLITLMEGITGYKIYFYFCNNTGQISYYSGGLVNYKAVVANTWYRCFIEWRSTPSKQFRVWVDSDTPSAWSNPYATWTNYIDGLLIHNKADVGSGTSYLDTFETTTFRFPTTSDTVTVSESVLIDVIVDRYVTTSDTVTVSESVTVSIQAPALPLTISKSESITVSEARNLSITGEGVASETVTVTDTPIIEMSEPTLFVQVTETITISESVEITEPFSPPIDVVASEGTAYSGGFKYRRSVTLSEYSFSNTNFAFLFTGTFTYLKTVANGGKVENANGYDIAFSLNSDGSARLDHEIRSYDATTGRVEIFVRIPTASNGLVIYLFYGSEAVTSSLENKAGVWVDWAAVYHLTQSGTGATNEFLDSSRNGRHGTALSGKVPTYTTTAGKFASGNVFNDSAIALPQLFTSTIGAWLVFVVASQSTVNTNQHVVSADESGDSSDLRFGTFTYGGFTYPTTNDNIGVIFEQVGSYKSLDTNNPVTVANTFYNSMAVSSLSGGDGFNIYVGRNGFDNYYGISFGSSVTLSISATKQWLIGYNNQKTSEYWTGTINEVWILGAATTLSPINWSGYFRNLHRNIDSPSTFFTIGSESTGTSVGILDLSFLSMEREVSATETVTVSESVNLSISIPVQASENITVTDAPTILLSSPFPTPNVSDTVTVSDTANISNPIDYLTVSDTVTVTDTPTIGTPFTIPLSLAVTDTISVTETVNLSAPDVNVPVSDTISLSEVAAIAFSTDLTALQNVFILENVAISVSDPQIVASDTISVTDSPAALWGLSVYASETITVSEDYTLIPPVEVYAFDAVTLFDDPQFVQTLTFEPSDTITVSELVNVASTLNVLVAEIITVTESTSRYVPIELYTQQMVMVSDINAVIVREPPDFKPVLSDNVFVSEGIISVSVLQVGALGISVIDTVTITEPNTNVVQPFPPIQVSDSVTVTDIPNAVTPTVLFINVSDSIVVSDLVTPYYVDIVIPPASHNVSVYEVIVVTEEHLVDRDIWGDRPHGSVEGWVEGGTPTTIYTEQLDPTTIWTEVVEHER